MSSFRRLGKRWVGGIQDWMYQMSVCTALWQAHKLQRRGALTFRANCMTFSCSERRHYNSLETIALHLRCVSVNATVYPMHTRHER
eukprot:23391-Eustigmatos_ZCMA.PRE.1